MINTFLDPAQLPSRTQDQKTFDILMGQLVQLLPTWGNEINGALGQFNAGLAGGAYALPYVFDSGTADADPGPGRLRLSSATQSSATVLRLDLLAGAQDVTSILDQFDASTSDVKGSIRLVKVGDPSKWLTFNVMARTAPSGYRNMTVVNTGGSSASPFAASDGVLVFFQRNGDKGSAGDLLPPMIYVREEYASGVNAPTYVQNQKRTLNTVVTNTISGASLGGSIVTLPPGTYDFEGNSPIYSQGGHRAYLQDSDTSEVITLGTTEYAGNSMTRSFVRGRIGWSSGNRKFIISQKTSVGVSGGAAFNGGTNEVYAELIFRKVG